LFNRTTSKPAVAPRRFWGAEKYVTWVRPEKTTYGMHPAIEQMYKDYNEKSKMAPIDVRVRVFREAGYPEHVIETMKVSHQKRMDAVDELAEFTHNIFGDMSSKKSAAVKKKTLVQLLGMKFPKKPKFDPLDSDDV
jgi:hypothetical protein